MCSQIENYNSGIFACWFVCVSEHRSRRHRAFVRYCCFSLFLFHYTYIFSGAVMDV